MKIDLNMVRAGVVDHPEEWRFGGYHEIQSSKHRYSLVNKEMTANYLGIKNSEKLLEYQSAWIDAVLKNSGHNKREKNGLKALQSVIWILCSQRKQNLAQKELGVK